MEPCPEVWEVLFEDDFPMTCDLPEGHEGSHHDPASRRWWAMA